MSVRICVASSFPESGNRNFSIVGDLAEGFRAIIGDENVHALPYLGLSFQVARLKPTLVVLVGSALPVRCDYRELAQACRAAGSVFAFWTVEDPYEFDANYKFCKFADLVFSNDAWACRFYERDRVYHLPTAAAERHARSLDNYPERPLDVFFCGVGFANRQVIIADAMPILERHRTLIIGANWPAHPSGIVANRRISNATLIEYYAASRCVINIGRMFSYANNRRSLPAVTPGPRTFEAAMVGCVQLYFQPSKFLAEYFAIGKEVATFDSVDELEEKLEKLADPETALSIAQAGQARALADHTYTARARTILAHAGLTARGITSKMAPTVTAPHELPARLTPAQRSTPALKRLASHAPKRLSYRA